jgi:hypothetical protein
MGVGNSVKSDFFVIQIEPWKTYEWLLKKHYSKRIPSISFAFGLYKNTENPILVGVLTIGKPASPSLCVGVCGIDFSKYVYELNRLVVNDNLPKNTLSYFVSSALRLIKTDLIIVSYADTEMNHTGYIYQATNWIYTGKTKERTDIGFEDGTHSRHYDKGIDKKTNRKHRSSKHRYIYFVGKKSKTFSKNLKYQLFPYPKGKNSRYDSGYNPSVQIDLFCWGKNN